MTILSFQSRRVDLASFASGAFGRRLTSAVTVVAALIFVHGSAQGGPITQIFSSTQHLELGDSIPEGRDVKTFYLNQFDPALGTLTGVHLSLESDFTGGVTFYHPTLTLDYTYTPKNYVVADFPGLSSPPDLFVDVDLPTQTQTAKYWKPTASGLATATLDVATGDLAQFIGTGLYETTLTIEDRSTYLSSNPLAFINEKYVKSDATLQVEYTYTPAVAAVPEPTGGRLLVSLLAAGCGCLLVFHRRRNAHLRSPKA